MILHIINNYTIFVMQNNKGYTTFEDLTEQEQELIIAIRNLQKSRHNPSDELLQYVYELLERLIDY